MLDIQDLLIQAHAEEQDLLIQAHAEANAQEPVLLGQEQVLLGHDYAPITVENLAASLVLSAGGLGYLKK